MASEETNISKECQKTASKLGSRLFRNNRGMFKTLDGLRKVRAGLEVPGSSDLIGWTQVEITPDMVGEKVAIFTAFEVKTGQGAASEDQARFIDNILNCGGIAGIVRSSECLKKLLNKIC